MTKKLFRIATITYIITLGAVLGAGLFAGAVVAPTIFHSELLLGGELLSNFQEGLIMTVNFQKLGFVVNFMIFFILFYEATKWKAFESDRWTLISAFLVVATGLMFTSYYIPDIIEMQLAGETMTQSDAFLNTHKGSEINFKIFSFAILALLILNLKKALR
ncbi:membrane protein [hydrothermal vent metagenome]|uniref:Membrane protein n=1 Tax=hydrothermal vent metagenome TaxID=652676 RepID=A0A1W1CPL7_9ZZZZ